MSTASTSFFPRVDDSEIAAVSATFADTWWTAALRGVFAILFALFAWIWPGVTLIALLLVFAAFSFVDGVMSIIMAIQSARRGQRWALQLVQGLLGIAVAPIVLFWPGITLVAIMLVIAVWAIASGVLTLAGAPRLAKGHGRGWLIASAVASIVFGILLAIAPLIGAFVLTIWIGAWAFVYGITLLVLAYELRTRRLQPAPRRV
jgi:uncharacterized membrane protein HdeD (DUF308 family)